MIVVLMERTEEERVVKGRVCGEGRIVEEGSGCMGCSKLEEDESSQLFRFCIFFFSLLVLSFALYYSLYLFLSFFFFFFFLFFFFLFFFLYYLNNLHTS